jgi:DNA-directed RNA polymerases I and III subunit RPAC2
MSVNEVRWTHGSTPKLRFLPESSSGTTSSSASSASASASSRTFCLGDEDHTLGNALRHVLIQNHHVTMAAYSVPHPAESVVHIRVQTDDYSKNNNNNSNSNNNNVTAVDALRKACQTLSSQCDILLQLVEETMPEVREDRLRMEQILLEDGEEEDDDEEEEYDGNDGNNAEEMNEYDDDEFMEDGMNNLDINNNRNRSNQKENNINDDPRTW